MSAPYIEPTVETFRARFAPRFDAVSDAIITQLIADAVDRIDSTWIERDRNPAQMYLVAHWLLGETGTATVDRPGVIASESWGPMSVSYAVKAADGFTSEFESTEFGRRYLALRRRNFPAVKVV